MARNATKANLNATTSHDASKATTPKADDKAKSQDKAKSNTAAVYDALIADCRLMLTESLDRENKNVKANQQIAYDIMRFREMQIAEGVKPATWRDLNDGESAARSKWRTALANRFIGKAPSTKGDKTQAMIDATDLYKRQRRIFDDACDFCVAIGIHGVTSNHFSETNGCFAIPAAILIPKDDKWMPMFELADALNNDKMVPLLNRRYSIAVGTEKVRDVRSSVKHVLSAWKSKPPVRDDNASTSSGASDVGTLDPKTIKVVLDKAGIDRLAKAMWADLNIDPKAPMSADMFEKDTWNTMLNIAARINAMAATQAQKSGNKLAASK